MSRGETGLRADDQPKEKREPSSSHFLCFSHPSRHSVSIPLIVLLALRVAALVPLVPLAALSPSRYDLFLPHARVPAGISLGRGFAFLVAARLTRYVLLIQ